MSGNVIGAVIGVGVSFLSGGAIPYTWGWMIGSAVGGMLFPAKGPAGPRLSDLKVQASEYGRPIPIVYSVCAVAGNVMWASDIIEREGSSGGGKGGAESTSYSYFANFAVAICEGEVALGRIWAGPDKRLIYDPSGAGTLEGGGTLTFYSGSETQTADPLMESFEGVGSVPAYRGIAYVVFEEFPLANDGNRIPFLTIEVGQEGNSAPENLGTVWFHKTIVTDDYVLVGYFGSYQGVIARNLSDYSFAHNIALAAVDWSASDVVFWDETNDSIVRAHQSTQTYTRTVLTSGVVTTHTLAGLPAAASIVAGLFYGGDYVFGLHNSATGETLIVVVDPATNTITTTYTFDAGGETFTGPLLAPPIGNFLVGATTSKIRRYDLDGSITSIDLGAKAGSGAIANAVKLDQSTGHVWHLSESGSDLVVSVTHTTTGLMLSTTLSPNPFWPDLAYEPWLFVPGDGGARPNRVYVVGQKGGTWEDRYVEFDPDAGGYIGTYDGTYHGTNEFGAVIFNPTTEKLVAFRYMGQYAVSATLDPTTIPFSTAYMGGADSSLAKQTLAQVVADLSTRAGLSAPQYDVTALTDTVDGFMVGQQMPVREALAALAPAYFFDAVESQGVVKFVKRGGAIAVVVPDADVGAYESGSEGPDALTTVRRMEDELPATLNVNYTLEATDYSPATKYARRLVGASGSEETLEFPLVLSDTKAQEVAEVNLHSAWVGRITYQFSLPRKYSYLEPTDIIVVHGYTMRLVRIVQSGGLLKCEAVADDSDVYSPEVIVTETPASTQTVSTPGLIYMELM